MVFPCAGVLGSCLVDISPAGDATLSYLLNGDPVGVAVSGVPVLTGLAPALCVGPGFACDLHFGPGGHTLPGTGAPAVPPPRLSLAQWFDSVL